MAVDPARVAQALRAVADRLDAEYEQRSRLGIHITDYTLLMDVCYGPLLVQDPSTGQWGLVPRRERPDGALEAARALTARVVEALGGEYGATADQARAAAKRIEED